MQETQINFQPIFDYLDTRFKEEFENFRLEFRAEFDPIKISIDNLSREVKETREELQVANHRVDRLEHWAKPVGKKVRIPIDL
jgi:hypothetical protein